MQPMYHRLSLKTIAEIHKKITQDIYNIHAHATKRTENFEEKERRKQKNHIEMPMAFALKGGRQVVRLRELFRAVAFHLKIEATATAAAQDITLCSIKFLECDRNSFCSKMTESKLVLEHIFFVPSAEWKSLCEIKIAFSIINAARDDSRHTTALQYKCIKCIVVKYIWKQSIHAAPLKVRRYTCND